MNEQVAQISLLTSLALNNSQLFMIRGDDEKKIKSFNTSVVFTDRNF